MYVLYISVGFYQTYTAKMSLNEFIRMFVPSMIANVQKSGPDGTEYYPMVTGKKKKHNKNSISFCITVFYISH